MTQQIILTADDFGLNSAISRAIVKLVKKQRLSAVGCMTNIKDWSVHLSELLAHKNHIDIGLHFNLTDGYLLHSKQPAFPLKALILKAYLQKIKIEEIETELLKQIDEFENKAGFLPQYIDGHQHIQQLPIIRTALVNIINKVWNNQTKPYVRVSHCHRLAQFKNFKALIIHLMGSQSLRKLLEKNKIYFNSSFAGIYNLHPSSNYFKLFKNFINQLDNNGILMCHPGILQTNEINDDPIALTRSAEFEFLLSDEFLALKQTTKISIEHK